MQRSRRRPPLTVDALTNHLNDIVRTHHDRSALHQHRPDGTRRHHRRVLRRLVLERPEPEAAVCAVYDAAMSRDCALGHWMTATLVTQNPSTGPHAITVEYGFLPGLCPLVFLSRNRALLNAETDPRASFLVLFERLGIQLRIEGSLVAVPRTALLDRVWASLREGGGRYFGSRPDDAVGPVAHRSLAACTTHPNEQTCRRDGAIPEGVRMLEPHTVTLHEIDPCSPYSVRWTRTPQQPQWGAAVRVHG